MKHPTLAEKLILAAVALTYLGAVLICASVNHSEPATPRPNGDATLIWWEPAGADWLACRHTNKGVRL